MEKQQQKIFDCLNEPEALAKIKAQYLIKMKKVFLIAAFSLISLLAPVFGDDTYIQVTDYYKDDKPVTRLLKYLVSDDGLDTNEMKLVFSTTNDQSYHFRSGGFKTITFSKKENEK